MFDLDGSFLPDGRGDYTSISQPGSPSPAYTVAKAAKRLVDDGHDVELPINYTADVLDDITWMLGYYDTPQHVTARQADDLRQIARTLRETLSPHLEAKEREAVSELLR